MGSDVIVVGSVNRDLVASVTRRPAAGETVLARSFAIHSGGKGANQAAAAARAGARVALVGAVGDDAAGAVERQALERCGVDVGAVAVLAGEPTGLALITVTDDGENSIVVVPGANACVAPDRVEQSLRGLCRAGCVVMLQAEVPAQVVEAAARCCHGLGVRVVLNNGPVLALSRATLGVADPLVVNETEAAQMAGAASLEAQALAGLLMQRTGARSVIVTLGGRGSVWRDGAGAGAVPAQEVQVVDTTGAGDAFIGTLAACLARGLALRDACEQATHAAGAAVTWQGARPA